MPRCQFSIAALEEVDGEAETNAKRGRASTGSNISCNNCSFACFLVVLHTLALLPSLRFFLALSACIRYTERCESHQCEPYAPHSQRCDELCSQHSGLYEPHRTRQSDQSSSET